jgi:hypothetical protein
MIDAQDAERRTEDPLKRYLGTKYTFDHDEQGNLTVTEEPYVSNMPRKGKRKHKDFWDSRENLDYIRRYMNSREVSEWAGLGSMLEIVSQAIPPGHTLPDIIGTDTSLNGIIGLGGTSGDGKSIAINAGGQVLDIRPELDIDGVVFDIRVTKVGTGEGIPKLYGAYHTGRKADSKKGTPAIPAGVRYHKDRAIQKAADVDTLYAQAGRSGATLLPECISACDGDILGHDIAGEANRIPLGRNQYRWSLILGVQFSESQRLLDTSGKGLLQRILFWPTEFRDRIDHSEERLKPLEFIPPAYGCGDEAGQTDSQLIDGVVYLEDLGRERPATRLRPIGLPRCAIEDTYDFSHRRRNGLIDPEDKHENLLRLKLAARFMWFDGRIDMNEEDWQLAGYVIDRIHKPTRERLREGAQEAAREQEKRQQTNRALVKNSVDARMADVLDFAQKLYEDAATDEVTWGELKRKHSRNNLLGDAVEYLVKSGKWVEEKTDSRRPGRKYRSAPVVS